jgi:hypothetical protein
MINSGKNVLCEKPMTLCKRQTQELVDLAKEKNVFLMEVVHLTDLSWQHIIISHIILMTGEVSESVVGYRGNFLNQKMQFFFRKWLT